jgi:hypothetical protein
VFFVHPFLPGLDIDDDAMVKAQTALIMSVGEGLEESRARICDEIACCQCLDIESSSKELEISTTNNCRGDFGGRAMFIQIISKYSIYSYDYSTIQSRVICRG